MLYLKRVMLRIRNSLMAASIARSLGKDHSFLVTDIGTADDIAEQCTANQTDILLMEATYGIGTTLEDCLRKIRMLHKQCPGCKVVLLCDDNSVPEIARQVAQAKRDGQIDDFVYSSVSEAYLTALLTAI